MLSDTERRHTRARTHIVNATRLVWAPGAIHLVRIKWILFMPRFTCMLSVSINRCQMQTYNLLLFYGSRRIKRAFNICNSRRKKWFWLIKNNKTPTKWNWDHINYLLFLVSLETYFDLFSLKCSSSFLFIGLKWCFGNFFFFGLWF